MTEPLDVFDDRRAIIYQGDCLSVLAAMPSESVQCVVTSPPYWGLRDYGVDGQLGLEKSPDEYVSRMVEVFRAVRRVLRDDGTLFLNLGDSYAAGGRGSGEHHKQKMGEETALAQALGRKEAPPGLKPKDLCEIPSDVVRALRADGWWLRARIPWLKRNAMPESARDRPTSAVEYLFLLTKAERYFYDGEAVKVRGVGVSGGACFGKQGAGADAVLAQSRTYDRPEYTSRARRNSDWFFESWQGLYEEGDGPLALIVNPVAYKGIHFATFPPGLVEPCILAGTSEKGACPKCGKAWERIVKIDDPEGRLGKGYHDHENDLVVGQRGVFPAEGAPVKHTIGFRPGCSYGGEPVPCVVLDPFCGSGTVGAVALPLGRNFLGIELNPAYIELARERIVKAVRPATGRSEKEDAAPLFVRPKP